MIDEPIEVLLIAIKRDEGQALAVRLLDPCKRAEGRRFHLLVGLVMLDILLVNMLVASLIYECVNANYSPSTIPQ